MSIKWMTYRALGDALGISPDGARLRARRHKLKTKMGKDGAVLVEVPEGYLTAPSRHRRKAAAHDALAATTAHVTDLRAALERAHRDVDHERRRAEAAENERRKVVDALIAVVPKAKP